MTPATPVATTPRILHSKFPAAAAAAVVAAARAYNRRHEFLARVFLERERERERSASDFREVRDDERINARILGVQAQPTDVH
jgi:hypothetical protein